MRLAPLLLLLAVGCTRVADPSPAPEEAESDAVLDALAAKAVEQRNAQVERMIQGARDLMNQEEVSADHVTVRHLLVSFREKIPTAGRNRQEAAELAAELWLRSVGGADFASLVREYSDDSPDGVYDMADHGVMAAGKTVGRGGMVKGFGDVAWRLEPGELGVALFHKSRSPYGWHIIQRLE